MRGLIQLLVLLQASRIGYCIQCYHCSYNTFASDNSALDFILSKMSKISNERCQLLTPNDPFELDVRNCPKARPGHTYKCGVINGVVTAKVLSIFTVEYNTIEHDCIEVSDDNSDYSDGCHSDLPSSGPIRKLVDQTFEGTNLGSVEFTGEACYDSSTPESISGTVCPRCSWTELDVSNSAIQWFIDFADGVRDGSCRFESSDDYYEVNYRNCPRAPSGQVAKCGDIDGRITGRVANVDYVITSLQRDCVNGPESVASFSDGCHDETGSNAIIAPLIQESLGNDNRFSDANFQGRACFQRYFAPLAGGATHTAYASTLFLILCLFIATLLNFT